MRKRLIWVGLLVLAAVGYLAYTSWQGAALYYLTPSEAVAQGASLNGRSFRLAGLVAEGSVRWDAETSELRFVVTDGSSSVPVLYRGAAPDNFAPGQQIVAEGTADGNGGLVASRLIVKCPSKYEQVPGAVPSASGRRNLLVGGAAILAAVLLVAVASRLLGRPRKRGGPD